MIRPSLIALVAAALGAVACSAPNPDYVDPVAARDLGHGPRDLAPPVDCAMRPSPCSAADRSCVLTCGGGYASAGCAGGTLAVDRTCPNLSGCTPPGYCQAPPLSPGTPLGLPCMSESQCHFSTATAPYTCAPFLLGGKPTWHCALVLGQGGSGDSCTSNDQCRTGFCIAATHTCFRYCSGSDMDCPSRSLPRGNVQLVCRPEAISVEGATFKTTSCVLP